jgi:hypothetical protein
MKKSLLILLVALAACKHEEEKTEFARTAYPIHIDNKEESRKMQDQMFVVFNNYKWRDSYCSYSYIEGDKLITLLFDSTNIDRADNKIFIKFMTNRVHHSMYTFHVDVTDSTYDECQVRNFEITNFKIVFTPSVI